MITVNRSALSAALDAVTPLTKTKSPIPALRNVLIVSHGKSVTISATNLETSITRTIEANGDQFATLAPCVEFAKVASGIAGDEIELRYDDKKQTLTVGGGKSKYVFRCLSPDDFPTLPKIEDGGKSSTVSVNAASLADAIERTRTFIDADGSGQGFAFTGVQLTVFDKQFRMIGASRAQASIVRFCGNVKAADRPIIVAGECLGYLLQMLRSIGDSDVDLSFSGRHWSLATDGATIIGRIMEGEYPDVESVAPKQNRASVELSRSELISACQRLSALRGDSLVVKLESGKGELVLEYANKDVGDGTERIEAEIKGEFKPIGFKAYFIVNAAQAGRTERVRIELPEDPTKGAAIFKDIAATGADWFSMLAPIRLGPA